MELTLTVDVFEHCRISPPSGSVSTTSIPLTFYDLIFLPFSPVQRLFFYEFHHSIAHFTDTIIPNMKQSLSLTLQHFYSLAGNLTWPQHSTKPEILYKDGDSVSFVVAETDYDFYHLVGNHGRVINELLPLLPLLHNASSDELLPLMAFQVTLFPNKGICIGITFNHVVADGRALHHFIKTWASICRTQGNTSLTTESLPCYDRAMLKDSSEIDKVYLNHLKKLNITRETFSIPRICVEPKDKLLATFVLAQSDIERLKKWILTRLANDKKYAPPLHLSTFVVTCAYVWVGLIKARLGEDVVNDSEDDLEYFIFAADYRGRIDPPLPMTYFGNCLGAGMASTKRSNLMGGDGIAVAAEIIGKEIRMMEEGDEVLKELEKVFSYDFSSSPDGVLSVAGSPKLGIYQTDFGWGNPKKTEVGSIASSGAISLHESPNQKGAVEIGFVRNKMEIEAFNYFFAKTIENFPLCKIGS